MNSSCKLLLQCGIHSLHPTRTSSRIWRNWQRSSMRGSLPSISNRIRSGFGCKFFQRRKHDEPHKIGTSRALRKRKTLTRRTSSSRFSNSHHGSIRDQSFCKTIMLIEMYVFSFDYIFILYNSISSFSR